MGGYPSMENSMKIYFFEAFPNIKGGMFRAGGSRQIIRTLIISTGNIYNTLSHLL